MILICIECGRSFECPRFRATCSRICRRERRLRQKRGYWADRTPEQIERDAARSTSPERRARNAAAARAKRAAAGRTDQKRVTEMTPAQREAIRAWRRRWYATSEAAERMRERIAAERKRLAGTPQGDARLAEKRMAERARKARRALLETQRITTDEPDRNDE